MSSKISGATLIAAKVIIKTSLVTFKPKQPTTYDTYFTKVFVVLEGTLRFATDVTSEVKKKILEDFETDLKIDQVEWTTASSVSLGLINKGWNAVSCDGQWYIWPVNGSTVKSLVTIDYINKTPIKNVVKGETYSQEDLEHDKSSENIWAIICFIALVLFLIFLFTR